MFTPLSTVLQNAFTAIAEKNRGPWGSWHFDPRTLTLISEPSGYWVPIRDCWDHQSVLRWIAHVRQKSWCTPEDLGQFVAALDDLVGLQDVIPLWPEDDSEI